MSVANPCELTEEQRSRIYESRIGPWALALSQRVDKPAAVITGGQPGSGKSRLTDAAVAEFEAQGGCVVVDADILRRFHPYTDLLLRTHDKESANLTQRDAGAWAARLIRDAASDRRNLVIDQTSRDPTFDRLAGDLHGLGYRVELRAMAVKALVSEQRIISRYERHREVDRGGRFATRDRHDAAYEGLRGSIERVEVTRCVDAVTLYDASHQPIYRNRLANDRWQDAPSAAQALSTERERSFTDPEREGYAAALARIDEMLKAPDRRATAEDFARVQDLRERSWPRQADRPEYKLSEAENQRIFEQDVIPYLLATAHGKLETQAEPVMVGGQPGAGKSRSMDSVKDDLEHDGGVVEISADDLRKFHPLNDALMRRDDRSAANFTHADARLWAEKAERFARERRFNLVLEGTMKTPDHTASRLSDYRRDGYFVEVRLIATPERSSWQGVLERYEKQRADNGAGRMTPKDIHDAAIAGVLGTVECIERDGLANRVRVDRRGAEQIYCATLSDDGTWKHAQVETSPRRAIEQERAAPWSVRQWDAHIAGYDRIEALLHRHGRDATAQEFRQIADLRESALAARAQSVQRAGPGPTSTVRSEVPRDR